MLTRVYAIDDPTAVRDPEYAVGLENVVSETIAFAIEAIEREKAPPLPLSLPSQARLAARNGVSFETIVRRYLAGFLTLIEFVEQEAPAGKAPRLRRYLARLLEDLIEEIGHAHSLEAGRRAQSRESRRVKLIQELLAGNLADTAELAPDFDFDAWHIGLIGTGASAGDAIRRLAKASDRRLLQVCRGEHSVWAWLTGRRRLESTKLQLLAAKRMPADGCLAFGEPHRGLAGWRLSYHQAAAALRVGLRRDDRIVRYGEVPTEASLLHDPVRAASLRHRYLVPLGEEGDGGLKARETLHAYFSRNRNISSTATAIGVARQTVACRLRAIEERLGSDLHACAHELEAALTLDRLECRENAPGL
jgi:sugar diacid utilization regulator